MADNPRSRKIPHPHLCFPILYILGIPESVQWNQIATVFSSCGAVTSRGRDTATTNRGVLNRLTIVFQSVFQAEMALATLQGAEVPGNDPPFFLEMCSSPDLIRATPSRPLAPLYIKYSGHETEVHPTQQASAQDIFTWFRRAGPLVSVRVNEDLGWPHPTCVLQYWQIPHAQYARLNCNTLHPALKDMPPFALRVYHPRNLYCATLGAPFTNVTLWEMFSKFGEIVEGPTKKVGVPDSFDFVSFATEQQAGNALKALNGTQLEGRFIIVRFHETNHQIIFRLSPAPKWSALAEETRQKQYEAQKKAEEDARKKEEEMQERKAEEEREKKKKEAEWLRREEEKREAARRALRDKLRQDAAKREREKAARLAELARFECERAATEMQDAQDRVDEAAQSHSDFKERCAEAAEAVLAAERALQAVKVRRAEVAEASIAALLRKHAAQSTYRDARARFEEAENESELLRGRYEEAIRNEEEVLRSTQVPDEEAEAKDEERRQAELAESIRKMKEIREQEEADRQEVLRQAREKRELEERQREAERLAQEEKLREEMEERARKAEESLARSKQEEARRQAYQEAHQHEQARCRARDVMLMPSCIWTPWAKRHAVDRFKAVSIEFDEIVFRDTQPLTFESVPWPLIRPPLALTFDDIEWSAVEEFFQAAELLVDAAEYRSMVGKAHLRFHPDRWRARGLLLTVLDEDLRQRLEEAGNVVAQAITPLWLASRAPKPAM